MVRVAVVVLTERRKDGIKIQLLDITDNSNTHVKVTLKSSPGFGLGIARIQTVLLVVTVAVVPLSTVLLPRSRADPAKLVLAPPARHVVAATVLLIQKEAQYG